MKLGKDTASLTNWLVETLDAARPRIGETLAELMWTDRRLLICVGYTPKGFEVEDVSTHMTDWTTGTQYPDRDEKDQIKTDGNRREIRITKNGYRVRTTYGKWEKISLYLGAKTGYRDPCF